jgi:hypothetical protein
MSVTPLKQKTLNVPGKAIFQSAVSDLAANELVFAVVGPVGSRTSEAAIEPDGSRRDPLRHPVYAENSDSDVLVMQSTDERMRYDASDPLNRTRNWCIVCTENPIRIEPVTSERIASRCRP